MMRVPRVRLQDACQINPRLPRNHGIEDGSSVSFVPMAAIDESIGSIRDRHTRPFHEVKKGYTHFREDDVLFAKITPCMQNGKSAVARGLLGGIGFGSTEFHVLRPGDSVIPEWIFYFIRQQSFREEARRNFTGTAGQQRVPQSFIGNVPIPLPPLHEQRRKVDLLSRAEGIVRLRREAQRKAAELIPAVFVDLFGDPDSNPMSWPVLTLGELIAQGPQNGLYKHKSHYGSGMPILRIDGFYDGVLRNPAGLQRVRIEPAEIQRYRLQTGDIVINRVNSPEYLGKSALIPELPEPTVFESNMMRVELNARRIIPEFAIALMQTSAIRRQVLARAKHAINQSSINQQDVKALRIPLPPLHLQRKFSSRADSVRSIAAQQASALATAQATFDTLLHRTFAAA